MPGAAIFVICLVMLFAVSGGLGLVVGLRLRKKLMARRADAPPKPVDVRLPPHVQRRYFCLIFLGCGLGMVTLRGGLMAAWRRRRG